MIRFTGMTTAQADALRNGGLDANGQQAEEKTSDGNGNPCRHCLQMIGADELFLVFAYRPFGIVNPYAEVGPVFLHGADCAAFNSDSLASSELPPVLYDSAEYLVRAYDQSDRIVYGSGAVTANTDIVGRATKLFSDRNVSFIHVRSATNNCWQARIDAATE